MNILPKVDSDHLAACQFREHGCQTMKIILRPLVERMIVTVGTFHPIPMKTR